MHGNFEHVVKLDGPFIVDHSDIRFLGFDPAIIGGDRLNHIIQRWNGGDRYPVMDSDKAKVFSETWKEFEGILTTRLAAVDECREKAAKIKLYEVMLANYEKAKHAFAEAHVPGMLAQFEGTVEEKTSAAMAQAKTIYGIMNKAPEHPFPEPDAETVKAKDFAAFREAAAIQIVASIPEGQSQIAVPVEVDGVRYEVIAYPAPYPFDTLCTREHVCAANEGPCNGLPRPATPKP